MKDIKYDLVHDQDLEGQMKTLKDVNIDIGILNMSKDIEK